MILLKILAAMEMLLGAFGLYIVLYITTYEARTGSPAGMGDLYLPFAVAFLCFGFLGAGLFFRKKWSWWLHVIALPLVAALSLVWWAYFDFDRAFIKDALVPVFVGAAVWLHLFRPRTRALFRAEPRT